MLDNYSFIFLETSTHIRTREREISSTIKTYFKLYSNPTLNFIICLHNIKHIGLLLSINKSKNLVTYSIVYTLSTSLLDMFKGLFGRKV